MAYVKKHQLAPKHVYYKRVKRNLFFSSLILIISLLIGTIGYHFSAQISWIDSFLNASMILTGMGPVNVMSSNPAKIFSSFYALFSGVVFLTTIAIAASPIIHRVLHRFHLEDQEI